jgi:hypothetical protein
MRSAGFHFSHEDNGEDVKLVQQLMRPAHFATIVSLHKALIPAGHQAQSWVVDVLLDRSRDRRESVAESAAREKQCIERVSRLVLNL